MHPDDDFEEILDMMVHDFEDMTFEGYKVLPNIDKERYTPMPGLEGPFQTMSGKPIYYDPKKVHTMTEILTCILHMQNSKH